ncbi:MAG: hypothetical protein ABSG00_09260 [Terracidiphilus sp.]|jgi:hypothetical protein
MKAKILIGLIAMVLTGMTAVATPEPSTWEQPAENLAAQIAEILGPGQARLTIRNQSTLSDSAIPTIRRLIEQDLKTHGLVTSGAESANEIRLTLSENQRERLWVAEIVEGNETRVAMVEIQHSQNLTQAGSATMLLRKERLPGPDVEDSLPCFSSPDGKPPLLAVAERRHGLIILKQNCLLELDRSPSGFFDGKTFDPLASTQAQTRDPRGIIVTNLDDDGFFVFLPGTKCDGSYTISSEQDRPPGEGWSLHCHASDDPWPIVQQNGLTSISAFYNAARNYFTGVVSPSLGVDLPPFYTAALLPRASDGRALLIGGIDGKVQLVENGALKPVSGARDWGSDFAVLHPGCGAGTQIIASGSGEALSDSLRAYELPAQEAVPASAALAVDGTVTALWSAPDGKSVFAVVRSVTNEYEVDRVTATCN